MALSVFEVCPSPPNVPVKGEGTVADEPLLPVLGCPGVAGELMLVVGFTKENFGTLSFLVGALFVVAVVVAVVFVAVVGVVAAGAAAAAEIAGVDAADAIQGVVKNGVKGDGSPTPTTPQHGCHKPEVSQPSITPEATRSTVNLSKSIVGMSSRLEIQYSAEHMHVEQIPGKLTETLRVHPVFWGLGPIKGLPKNPEPRVEVWQWRATELEFIPLIRLMAFLNGADHAP